MRIKDEATHEDLLAIPEDQIAEIVNGTLYVSPRPRSRHTRIASLLDFS